MKNAILIFVIVVANTATSLAQTTQGSLSFGGGLRYQINKESGDGDFKTTTFSFQPSVGYFISDNLAAGVSIAVINTKNDFGSFESTIKQFLAGPFVRYYKFTSNEKFAFTGEAGFLFGTRKTETNGSNPTKGGSFNFYIAPGFTYFFSEKWGLDFQLQGITYTKTDPNKDVDNNESSTFSFGAESFSPSLGFRFYLSK